jgi:uncharacterized protein YebE (UPF0316 family)
MFKLILIFLVGLLEAFLTTLNSKFRQKSNKLLSFITAFVSIFVWIYIVSQIVENISHFWLIASYALSYSLGDVLGLIFDKYLEKLAKIRKIKFFRRRNKRRKK